MYYNNDTTIEVTAYKGTLSNLFEQIKAHTFDILDLNVHEVILNYTHHLKQTNTTPDLDKASSFIYMASLLILQKGRALFPNTRDQEDDEEEDMVPSSPLNPQELKAHRSQLQKLAEKLKHRATLKRDVWGVPPTNQNSFMHSKQHKENMDSQKTCPQRIENMPILLLVKHYHFALAKAKKRKTRSVHQVMAPALPSLSQCLDAIHPYLKTGQSVTMNTLLRILTPPPPPPPPQATKDGVPATTTLSQQNQVLYKKLLVFLSLLELCRLSFVRLSQTKAFSDIDISVKKEMSLENKMKLLENSFS